ncbi:hypothetical protein NP233_g1703 [Leucocoprinus birnbaumii]|uniref:Uncharacterized protein n=1 Tax=Leucocoprinus birnbaumii TaxID=56174 RepID=A0AAD5VZI5_9AGAR|nr:hypothetical protein NP233_g1703 [Leucocoprinus birnbaumii]
MSALTVPSITVNGSPIASSNSNSSHPRPSEASSLPPTPAYDFTYERFDEYNLVVYQYHGVGVLVQAVPSYQEAVDIAINEFPALANFPREDIAICYETPSSGKMTLWRISESAWRNSARKFQPRTKLRIAVRGEDKLAGPSVTGKPPPYQPSSDEKARARSESPNPRPAKRPASTVTKQKSGSSISSFLKRF